MSTEDKELLDNEKVESLGKTAEDNIDYLKRRIKYAKTPMEKVQYERKLNALYKRKKG